MRLIHSVTSDRRMKARTPRKSASSRKRAAAGNHECCGSPTAKRAPGALEYPPWPNSPPSGTGGEARRPRLAAAVASRSPRWRPLGALPVPSSRATRSHRRRAPAAPPGGQADQHSHYYSTSPPAASPPAEERASDRRHNGWPAGPPQWCAFGCSRPASRESPERLPGAGEEVFTVVRTTQVLRVIPVAAG